jgi:hypothetical protein
MHKIKVSKKEMRENYYVIGIPVHKAQHLLTYQHPVAYSSGNMGWACDYYDVNNVVISTGYGYINNQRTAYDYDVLVEYDKKAYSIIADYDMHFEERMKQVNALLNEFIELAIYNYNKEAK